MKRNMSNWQDDIISSSERKALPVMTYPGLGLVGKNVRDMITDGNSQYLCIEAVSKRYPSLAAVTVMDLSVEAEAFGSTVRYSENEVPTVVGRIIDGMCSAESLKIPNVGEGRTGVYLSAAKAASQGILDRPVLGGHIGPFSLAGRLMDMTEIMIAMTEEPEIVHTVLEKCTQFLIEYAKAFKDCGSDGVIIAEPAAGLMSPAMCDEFSSAYVRRIVDAVQDESFLVVLHNCGNTVRLVDSMVSTGAKALHFGNAVKMQDILPQVPSNILAMGNIDPAGVLKNGGVIDVANRVSSLLDATRQYRNFVISSGCDIPPGTPLENVDAFFRTLAAFNTK